MYFSPRNCTEGIQLWPDMAKLRTVTSIEEIFKILFWSRVYSGKPQNSLHWSETEEIYRVKFGMQETLG